MCFSPFISRHNILDVMINKSLLKQMFLMKDMCSHQCLSYCKQLFLRRIMIICKEMDDSVQINLSLEVLIQNDFRMCPGRVVTFQCGEWSFPSGTENNHNVQFLFFLLYFISPSELLTGATPTNLNEKNCLYILFNHKCYRGFKNSP